METNLRSILIGGCHNHAALIPSLHGYSRYDDTIGSFLSRICIELKLSELVLHINNWINATMGSKSAVTTYVDNFLLILYIG